MKGPKLLAGLAVTGLILAACGGGGGGPTQTIKGTIKIGIDLPVTGADASDGQPAQNGAKLAIKQAGKVCGAVTQKTACFTLAAFPLDDAVNGVHDPAKGAQNVAQFVADPTVLAMVGPFNSSVARAEIPVANQVNLAMISPANTNECLTKHIPSCKDQSGNDKASLLRPKGGNNYFRVVTTDDIQGPAGADFAYDKLGKRKAFVINDLETFGKGVADNFAKEFKNKPGATVIDNVGNDFKSNKDFKAILTRAAAGGADVVYWGGVTATGGGILRLQMKGILDVPLVGPDGISGDQFTKDADGNADNSYYTVAAVNAAKVPEAQTFIANYKAEYSADIGAYSATAYEAANILIAAIGRAIDDAGGSAPTRDQVTAQVAKTLNFHGVLGVSSFDPNGDTTNKIISIYKWHNGQTGSGDFDSQIVAS